MFRQAQSVMKKFRVSVSHDVIWGAGTKLFLIIWLAAYRQLRLPRLTMDLESANSFNHTGGSADLMTALTIPEARHLIVGQD